MKVQSAEICLAKTRSVCKHGVKYRGELARRTRYDTQHLRGRGLLLQRFGEIGCALPQFIQQSGVLDRDDRLGGKVRKQVNLLVGERTNLLAIDVQVADQLI